MNNTPALISFLLKRSPADRALFSEQFASLASQTLFLAIVETIPKERVAELERLLEHGDGEKIEAFLETYIPDMDVFMNATLANLREQVQEFLDLEP